MPPQRRSAATGSGVTREVREGGIGANPFAVTNGLSDIPTQSEIDWREHPMDCRISLEKAVLHIGNADLCQLEWIDLIPEDWRDEIDLGEVAI